MRVAADRDAVVAAVEAATGRPLTVLTPEAEAALAFRGATAGLPPGAYVVVDIGGGSMQVAVGAPDAAPCTVSLPIGAAHLARRFLPGDPPAPADLARLQAYLAERIPPILPALPQAPAALLAAGGSARRLLALLGGAPGRLWPAAELGRLRDRLAGRPAAALAAAYALEAERIPLLAPAVLILEEVARAYGGPAFAVALGGLREGAILAAAAVRERRTIE